MSTVSSGFFKCFKMQMVINLAPVSLSNKKVNFHPCPRLTSLKKTWCHGKCLQEHFWASRFQNFLVVVVVVVVVGGGGHAPRTPLKARAFGARNLPRLVLKSGYGRPWCRRSTWRENEQFLFWLRKITGDIQIPACWKVIWKDLKVRKCHAMLFLRTCMGRKWMWFWPLASK